MFATAIYKITYILTLPAYVAHAWIMAGEEF